MISLKNGYRRYSRELLPDWYSGPPLHLQSCPHASAKSDRSCPAVQEAQKSQNEVLKIKAEAEKKIAAANGEAQALKIKGDAESEYNRKIAASLSPLIVQQMMLDKWDGKLPVYGTMPTLFKDITGK